MRAIVRRATSDDPARRFATVRDLARAVDARLARRRRMTRAAIAVAVVAALVPLLAFVVPAPAGERVHYAADVWGRDFVPASASNVAFDPGGRRVRLSASHPPWGCAQSFADLVDGVTEYHEWQHGYAFPPRPPGVCVSLDLMSTCGTPRDDASLCAKGDEGSHASKKLDALVSTARTLAPDQRASLGEWIDGVACGERWIDIELASTARVRAVRAWHHGRDQGPTRFGVLVDDGSGSWREVYKTTDENYFAAGWRDNGHYWGGPITADFAATPARRVRYWMDTCTTDPELGHGWLYEIEVFADLPRHEAWLRWLRGG
jgi:hypothetical protein